MKKLVMLNLGCGIRAVKGFINIDSVITLKDLKEGKGVFKGAVIEKGSKFLHSDMRKLPFKDNSVDYVECHQSIEHIPMKDVPLVFKEIYRVLKPGKKAVISTTNFADIAKQYLEICNREDFDTEEFFRICSYIYGNQLHGGEFHQSAFSPWYMKRLADTVGFTNVDIVSYPRDTKLKDGPKLKAVKLPKKYQERLLVCDYLCATLTK
jgi:SAM-dependent methyltransferase